MKWLSLLQHVPWTDVIANAPKVVDSAKKLWDTTVNKGETPVAAPAAPSGSTADAAAASAAPPSAQDQAITALQTRADALEQAVLALREQMQASSGLVKALAEQNTQLIAQLQAQSQQLRRLTLGLAGVGLLLVTLGGWMALR